jgi:Fibronectin type III domain/Calx-beta domain
LVAVAINDAGESEPIESLVSTGPPDLPSAPPAPEVADIRGGSVTISVQLPQYNGGDAITMVLYQGFKVEYTFLTGEYSTTLYGLAANTQYSYRAGARNARGETSGQTLKITTTEITAPSAVLNVQLVDASFDQMEISWQAARDSGGDSNMQYQVLYYLCNDTGSQLEPSHTQMTPSGSVLLKNLEYSSMYCISVAAKTSSGLYGPSSEEVRYTTEAPFPGRAIVHFPTFDVREDAGMVFVPVSRVDGSFGQSSFTYTTIDETAIAGVNYAANIGRKTLETNVKTGTIAIEIFNDDFYYPNITFIVAVRDEVTETESRCQVTITDDGDWSRYTSQEMAAQAHLS